MTLPKITIITPSFNQGMYLEETILSVLNQHYPNLEYIIIDGGSTDNSLAIIEKYKERLTYFISEKDGGQSEALNKGLKRASGDIVSWLCSDDVYVENTLPRIAQQFAEHPDAVLIHGKTILFGENFREQIKGATADDLQLKYFSCIPFPQPSSFFRKKLIDEQGLLDEHLHYGMDYDLLIRAALNYNIVMTDEIYSKYRMHAASKSVLQQRGFLTEWQKVFSKFIRSVANGKEIISSLQKINFYVEGKDVFSGSRKFTDDELKKILFYFLETQAHMYYTLLDKVTVRKLLSLLKEVAPRMYWKHSLTKIELRLMLPSWVIRAFRKK